MDDVTELSRLPKNIELFFTNLIVLFWDAGNLLSITAEDLKPFPGLKMFAVYDNNLVSLDGDLFQHTTKLNFIEFASNRITNVGPNLLGNLAELIEVDFSNNLCISANATTPEGIQTLKLKLAMQCPSLATTQVTATTTEQGYTTNMQSPPPVAPPIEDNCSIRCSMDEEFDELSENVRQQSEMIKIQSYSIQIALEENAEQSRIMAKMQETIDNQTVSMAKSEKRIVELENLTGKSEERINQMEKQLREILAIP